MRQATHLAPVTRTAGPILPVERDLQQRGCLSLLAAMKPAPARQRKSWWRSLLGL